MNLVTVELKPGQRLVKVSVQTLEMLEELARLWGMDTNDACRLSVRIAFTKRAQEAYADGLT